METPAVPAALAPVVPDERIQSLDVVRGFALIGILVMNVEYFNRPIAQIGSGMQTGLAGANLWVSYLVQYFVVGKFWTIFSLLFGMGFAVMLSRAERAGRDFLIPYLRRIVALAIFGALHNIFLWSGDILFSYAVAAAALLIVLYGRPKWIALAIAVCAGCGFVPGMNWFFGISGGLAFFGLAGWWLRGEQRLECLGQKTMFGAILTLLGTSALIGAVILWVVPAAPREARFGLPALGFALLMLGYFTNKHHHDKPGRTWRLGVGIYCFSFFMMTATGAAMYFFPEKPAAVLTKADAQKAAELAAERAKSRQERDERIAEETRVLTRGTYRDALAMRAERWVKDAPKELGFATLLISMFLIGTWFVRSGVMENVRAHMPLFRKLAMIGLPAGIGLGLLGSAIALHPLPGADGADGWQLASGLQMLGNLPASLGYLSLVILMQHSAGAFNKIGVLAPFGHMALTNYLSQSLIASIFFFGYGFGHWGISRLSQMLFVVVVIVLQVAFSHFWLARFRYGPVEWLWRAATYWTIPPMRIRAASPLVALEKPA